ncbi:MAG TPA: type II CAAX endopeptidase family protein [Terriglobia bacterium]|nr:type II CAAX endopeptidase family protein [Terriglobia bacterium]
MSQPSTESIAQSPDHPIRQSLTRSDFRVIALVVLVAAASLAVAIKYFSRAFPEASITFRVNRDDSLPIAAQFLQARGFKLAGYDHAAIFGYDDQTKLYLERTQGLEGMNRLARGPVHLWRWQHRWFRPLQKEEFRAAVTPLGEVVGFEHDLPEDAQGANLDQATARKLAEDFLTGVMKRDLNDLEFVEGSSNARPARTDHAFTWKQKSVNLGDGSLRVEVSVSGDEVSGYNEYVKVPDQWQRDYERLRSRNDVAQTVDQVFWLLLSVAMLALLILRLRDQDVPLRLAGTAGGIAAVLFVLSAFNTFSLSKFGYPTTDPYSSFIASFFTGNILSAVGVGVAIFLVVAAAEPAYREGLPGQLALRRAFTWRGLRTRSFFIANVVGLGLTFFFFAYQTVFYLVANHFGAWAPSDIPFTDDLNTRIPWVAVLFGGFFPAVTEEMQFRGFAIPFLRKYLGNWPLAIVLAAFNWSFLHSAYPNEPFFIRGLEVGLGGVIIGFIMLRFGIVATLIWHYSVDALYTAFLLLRSPNHYLMVSGGLTGGIMLIPLLISLLAYLRTRTFADEQELTNAGEGISRPVRQEEVPAAEVAVAYRPLTSRRITVAALLIALGIGAAAIPAYRFGEGIKLRVTRAEAIAQAEHFLVARGVPASQYRRGAWLRSNIDPLAVKYLLQFRTVRETDRLYRQATKLSLWQVRFFKPLQKEEYSVFVDPQDGAVFALRHELDEDAPGASLTAAQALAVGQQFVRANGFDLSEFDLQSSQSQARKAREDYELVWQARPGAPLNVADAHYRLAVDIAGDQVVSFSRFFKLPEAWVRQQTERTLTNILLLLTKLLLGAGLIGGGIWLFVRGVRENQVRWKQGLPLGMLLGVALLLAEFNAVGLMAEQYPTSLPWSTFQLFIVVGYVVVVLVVALLAWVAAAFAIGLYPDSWRILRSAARRVWSRDAALAIALTLGVGAGLSNLSVLIFNRFHAYASAGGDVFNPSLDTAFPAASLLLHGISSAVLSTAGFAVLICLVMLGWRQRAWWLWLALALLIVSVGPSDARSVGEFLTGWAVSVVGLATAFGLLAFFLRDNVAAYLAVAFAAPLADPLVQLLRNPVPFYRWNGVALGVAVVLLVAWLLLPRTGPAEA